MTIQFTVSALIPATPYAIYHAWLDSKQHSAMTGGGANTSAKIGGKFTAWDGYISGTNLELTPGARIVQTWRTTEFEESDPDSWLEITLVIEGEGTRLTLKHIELPAHGMQYREGWIENYFKPMLGYFKAGAGQVGTAE